MPWTPPSRTPNISARRQLPETDWRLVVAEIAERHDLGISDLHPYTLGEAVVWRAGEHVIKLTLPECAYQIDAEIGCLRAVHGKLGVVTPQVRAHGELSGWPYVVMDRIRGRPLSELWPRLDSGERHRLAHDLGELCRALHSLPVEGFPQGWERFWGACSSNVGTRHMSQGGSSALAASIDAFLQKLGPLTDRRIVPLHTELIGQHIYLERHGEQFRLSGLIDFADARAGAPPYEFGALVTFIFKGEKGLLREFLLAYGVDETDLTEAYSELLLAWSLCHRFASLARTLGALAPPLPSSLEELASRLFGVAPP